MNEEKKAAELTDKELEKASGGKGLGGKTPPSKYVNGAGTFCTNVHCTWSDDYSYTARTGSNRCPVCGSRVVSLQLKCAKTFCPNPDCDYTIIAPEGINYCPQCGGEMVYIISL